MGSRVGVCGSGLQGPVVLLCAIAFAVLSLGVDGKLSKQKLLEVDRKLKQLNKPPVKSIQSEDGDIIDCVDIYKQPAFDHPALKNHKIQMRPTQPPLLMEDKKKDSSATTVVSQTWHRSGSCPEGTVPIRRIRKRDLLRAASLEDYGKKPSTANRTKIQVPQDNKHFSNINNTQMLYITEANRSNAYLLTQGYNYIGARADINVWNPRVESDDEFTTAQIWLRSGPPDDFDSVEAGWMVNPSLYGDRLTRLFASWTDDSYGKTGCFDLVCQAFVQTGREVALGASIAPVSSQWGPQYQISITIYMDTYTSNWWLAFGNNITVGYWPAAVFSYLKHSAIYVKWGGEVYSSKVGKNVPHTTTAMGSGTFASGHWGQACFIQHVRIRDYSLYWKYPEWVYPDADELYCYSVLNYRDQPLAEPVFYFGGPGRNYNCP